MISWFHSCTRRILGKFEGCKNTLKQFLLFAQETLEDETEIKRPGDAICVKKTMMLINLSSAWTELPCWLRLCTKNKLANEELADTSVYQGVSAAEKYLGQPLNWETGIDAIWGFPNIGVPQNWWFMMENPY